MTEKRQAAMEILTDMLEPGMAEAIAKSAGSGMFGGELGELALDAVFGALWTRTGLGRRDRSLVTLGILIALRATEEMRFHFPAALKNGLTKDELAEVIYHASGYAGFPAAASARIVAAEVLADK
jgi:4-carboxymuconolactone decarboxylase